MASKYAKGYMVVEVEHFSENVIIYEGADVETEDAKIFVDETDAEEGTVEE